MHEQVMNEEIETRPLPTRLAAGSIRLRSCKLRRFYRIFRIMTKYTARVLAFAALLGGCASGAFAQTPSPLAPVSAEATAASTAIQAPAAQATPTICGVPVPAPATLPPAGSGPVLYLIAVCFPAQGNTSTIDAQTYLYYMELFKQRSQPTQNIWTPWNQQ